MTPLTCDELLAEVDETIIADAKHLLSSLNLSDLISHFDITTSPKTVV